MSNQQYRVQAPDIKGPEPLRTEPLPGDTFTGATRPEMNQNAAHIADALGAFNTNLLSFGSAYAHANAAANKALEEAAANKVIDGLTPTDLQTRYQAGQFDGATAHQRAFIDKAYANSLAATTKAEIDGRIKDGTVKLTSDNPLVPPPDVTAQITDLMKPAFAQASRSPVAFNAFSKEMQTHRLDLMRQQADAVIAQRNQIRTDTVDRSLSQVLDMSPSPEAAHNLMREAYRELGPGTAANMTFTDLDNRLMKVLTNRANDPNTATQALYLLQKERTDLRTGQPMPPIAAKPGLFDTSQAVIKAATSTLATDWVTKAKDVAAQQALSYLKKGDGSFTNVIDTPLHNPFKPAGASPEMVSAEEAKKTAVKLALAESAREARDGNETPTTQFNREYDLLAKNNVEHPVWKQTLKDAAGALTNPTALTDPNQLKRTMGAGELFMNLAERDYPYARSLMDKSTADTWDTYRTLRLFAGMNAQEAVAAAAQATATPETDAAKEQRASMAKTVREKVTASGLMDWGTWLRSWVPGGNAATASNVSIARQQVLELATTLSRVPGLDADKAIEVAKKAVTDHSVVINGYLIPDPSGQMKQNKPHLENIIERFVQQHGEVVGVHSPADLTVMPAGGGNFQLWSRADGVGVGHPVYLNDRIVTITGAGEGNMIQRMKDEQAAVSALQTQAASERAQMNRLVGLANERLTPEQQDIKRSELGRRKEAFEQGVANELAKSAQRLPGAVTPDHQAAITAQVSAMKDSANYALGLLRKLGVSLGGTLVPYGNAHMQKLPF